MKVQILRAAFADLEACSDFYDEFQAGLGAYCFESINRDIDELAIFAGIHEKRGRYFRAQAKQFPVSIFYRVSGEFVKVVAVLDSRRSPRWILKRLRERG